MNKQKIRIKSSQIFENHTDYLEEEYECVIEKFENGMKIVYDSNIITIEDRIVVIEKENTKLKIAKNKRNLMKYHTPYGVIDIETEGKEIQILVGPILLNMSYFMKVGNAEEYVIELQIVVVE